MLPSKAHELGDVGAEQQQLKSPAAQHSALGSANPDLGWLENLDTGGGDLSMAAPTQALPAATAPHTASAGPGVPPLPQSPTAASWQVAASGRADASGEFGHIAPQETAAWSRPLQPAAQPAALYGATAWASSHVRTLDGAAADQHGVAAQGSQQQAEDAPVPSSWGAVLEAPPPVGEDTAPAPWDVEESAQGVDAAGAAGAAGAANLATDQRLVASPPAPARAAARALPVGMGTAPRVANGSVAPVSEEPTPSALVGQEPLARGSEHASVATRGDTAEAGSGGRTATANMGVSASPQFTAQHDLFAASRPSGHDSSSSVYSAAQLAAGPARVPSWSAADSAHSENAAPTAAAAPPLVSDRVRGPSAVPYVPHAAATSSWQGIADTTGHGAAAQVAASAPNSQNATPYLPAAPLSMDEASAVPQQAPPASRLSTMAGPASAAPLSPPLSASPVVAAPIVAAVDSPRTPPAPAQLAEVPERVTPGSGISGRLSSVVKGDRAQQRLQKLAPAARWFMSGAGKAATFFAGRDGGDEGPDDSETAPAAVDVEGADEAHGGSAAHAAGGIGTAAGASSPVGPHPPTSASPVPPPPLSSGASVQQPARWSRFERGPRAETTQPPAPLSQASAASAADEVSQLLGSGPPSRTRWATQDVLAPAPAPVADTAMLPEPDAPATWSHRDGLAVSRYSEAGVAAADTGVGIPAAAQAAHVAEQERPAAVDSIAAEASKRAQLAPSAQQFSPSTAPAKSPSSSDQAFTTAQHLAAAPARGLLQTPSGRFDMASGDATPSDGATAAAAAGAQKRTPSATTGASSDAEPALFPGRGQPAPEDAAPTRPGAVHETPFQLPSPQLGKPAAASSMLESMYASTAGTSKQQSEAVAADAEEPILPGMLPLVNGNGPNSKPRDANGHHDHDETFGKAAFDPSSASAALQADPLALHSLAPISTRTTALVDRSSDLHAGVRLGEASACSPELRKAPLNETPTFDFLRESAAEAPPRSRCVSCSRLLCPCSCLCLASHNAIHHAMMRPAALVEETVRAPKWHAPKVLAPYFAGARRGGLRRSYQTPCRSRPAASPSRRCSRTSATSKRRSWSCSVAWSARASSWRSSRASTATPRAASRRWRRSAHSSSGSSPSAAPRWRRRCGVAQVLCVGSRSTLWRKGGSVPETAWRVQGAEAAQVSAALDAAQSAAQEMLEGRQALAAENVELEERLLALRNEQLRAQQSGSEWESRVAAARAEAKRAEGAAAAALAKKERERARLEERVAEGQRERERLLGRLKELAARKSGLPAAEAAAMFAGAENGAAAVPVARAEAAAQTDEAAPAQRSAAATADAACQAAAASSPCSAPAAAPPAAVQTASQPLDASMDVLRDPASSRISAACVRAERFAGLDGVQRMPPHAAALLPPLHWGTGDAAASVADTQVTVLDNIHRLVSALADSKAQLQAELAAAHAALAHAGLDVPTPRQRRSSATAEERQAPANVVDSANRSAATSPTRHVTIAATSPVELRTPPGGGVDADRVSPDVLQFVAAGANGAGIPAAAAVRSSTATPGSRADNQLVRGEGTSTKGLSAASLVESSVPARSVALEQGTAQHLRDVQTAEPELGVVRSAHVTPAKPALGIAAAPQSAPVTPADMRPARRRGWLGGVFGFRRPAEPGRSILTAA